MVGDTLKKASKTSGEGFMDIKDLRDAEYGTDFIQNHNIHSMLEHETAIYIILDKSGNHLQEQNNYLKLL